MKIGDLIGNYDLNKNVINEEKPEEIQITSVNTGSNY